MQPLAQLHTYMQESARDVRNSARILSRQDGAKKNDALEHMASSLLDHSALILNHNAQDLDAARTQGLEPSFIDRLALNPDRIASMASALRELIALPDPIGRIERMQQRPSGIMVGRQRIPLGVIGIIYEARPNVTSDAAGLCLKSGNGVLLKGGSAALASNMAIHQALLQGIAASRLDKGAHQAIGFVASKDRLATTSMLGLSEYIDVVIPRGGKNLIKFVTEHARIPIIKHDEGVCHVVVEGSACADEVDAILLNSKVQRPSVCNSLETILFLQNAVTPHMQRALCTLAGAQVTLHLDPESMRQAVAAKINPALLREASDAAYAQEFLGLEVAVRVVPDLDAAIAHIDTFGSQHTESLLTQNYTLSQRFLREVDSSVVMINASTRFSDGNQLGLGAEIGISTTRMHAYGPMGLEELTTTKFIVTGQGHIRPSS